MNKEENLNSVLKVLVNAKICAEYQIQDFFCTKSDVEKISAIKNMNYEISEINHKFDKIISQLNLKLLKLQNNLNEIHQEKLSISKEITERKRLINEKRQIRHANNIHTLKALQNKLRRLEENYKKQNGEFESLNNLRINVLNERKTKIDNCKEKYLIKEKDVTAFNSFNEYEKLQVEIDEIKEMKEFLSRAPYYEFGGTKKFANKIISIVNSLEKYKGKFEVECVNPKLTKVSYEDKLMRSPYYDKYCEGYVLKNLENGDVLYLGCRTLSVSKKEFDYVIKQVNKFVGKEIGDKIVDAVYDRAYSQYSKHECNYGHHHAGAHLNEKIF